MRFLLIFLFCFSPFSLAAKCPSFSAEQAVRAINSLTAEIQRHDALYYQQHQPEISDAEYDGLTNRLQQLQQCFPDSVSKNHSSSVTDSINNRFSQHMTFMGSLKKADSQVEVEDFINRLKPASFILQPKIDGIALELIYQNGQLTQAITRGNGEQGKNIIRHLQAMPLIPRQIDNSKNITLHGELFVRLDLIEPELLKQYTSARHLVAGLISQENAQPDHLKVIDFFPWRWINSPFDNETESHSVLKKLGFSLPAQHTHSVNSLAEVEQWRTHYSENKQAPFLMDGIVLKTDSISIRKQQAWSQDTPNWAMAWKFPASVGVSEVIAVEFNIGRTGQITPVLEFNPVKIKGETIARVSLGSVKNLKRKNIAIGDQISIQLKGAATPVFHQVVFRPPERKHPDRPPQNRYSAFSCLSLTPGCEQQFQARVNWLVGSNGLNWPENIRAQIKEQLVEGKIKKLQSVFDYESSPFIKVSMAAQIRALSLPDIGKTKSRKLAQYFGSWDALQNASEQDLINQAGLGQKAADTLRHYLQQREIRALIQALEK